MRTKICLKCQEKIPEVVYYCPVCEHEEFVYEDELIEFEKVENELNQEE